MAKLQSEYDGNMFNHLIKCGIRIAYGLKIADLSTEDRLPGQNGICDDIIPMISVFVCLRFGGRPFKPGLVRRVDLRPDRSETRTGLD